MEINFKGMRKTAQKVWDNRESEPKSYEDFCFDITRKVKEDCNAIISCLSERDIGIVITESILAINNEVNDDYWNDRLNPMHGVDYLEFLETIKKLYCKK